MKYGREITVEGQVRLVEVVEVPASAVADPASWLAIQFPSLSAGGWIHVADDNVSGAVWNGSAYDNPTSAATKPKDYSPAEFKEFCYGVLGALAVPEGNSEQKILAGVRAFGAIRRAGLASEDDAIFQAMDEYNKAGAFEKEKTLRFLAILNSTTPKIVSDAQLEAIAGSWATISA